MIFASFHQGKEEINLSLPFLYLGHSRLEAAPTLLSFPTTDLNNISEQATIASK
jgi:hypothetical protein